MAAILDDTQTCWTYVEIVVLDKLSIFAIKTSSLSQILFEIQVKTFKILEIQQKKAITPT